MFQIVILLLTVCRKGAGRVFPGKRALDNRLEVHQGHTGAAVGSTLAPQKQTNQLKMIPVVLVLALCR